MDCIYGNAGIMIYFPICFLEQTFILAINDRCFCKKNAGVRNAHVFMYTSVLISQAYGIHR